MNEMNEGGKMAEEPASPPEKPEKPEKPGKPEKRDELFVVGLGASAGGIRALKSYFSNTPAKSGIAYVVILHLSPEHDSKLAEVLQVAGPMPVTQVRDRVRIEPDHVYVIPPNQSLSMNEGLLMLSEMTKIEERRAPVDTFFRALAEAKKSHAACIILSGTGADGSLGLKRVKELGGLALVQDPSEAEFNDMPRHAIATGLIDYVLPVAEMPAQILAYRDKLRSVRVPVLPQEQRAPDEAAVRDILMLLRVRSGHDFANYKRPTVMRRIRRRITVNGLNDLKDYAQYLHDHPEEVQELLKDLLISVTNFFRDQDAFAALKSEVIPRIFDDKGQEESVRVWVPGCATGEEAYSLAMLLAEHTAELFDRPSIQIFATDIDERALAVAREGFYTETATADIPPEYLRRFFVKEMDGYRVRKDLREMILFAVHNVLKDPPFSHIDMISCRNLLIYLNRNAQDHLMQTFHFSLETDGFLFLGSSESADGLGDLFQTIDKDYRVYQRRPAPPRIILPTPSAWIPARYMQTEKSPSMTEQVRDWTTYSALHQKLLEQYTAPSLVIDENYDIVHMSERVGQYLQFTGGEPSYNLLKVVRPELRLELHTALFQAVQRRMETRTHSIPVRLDDRTQDVSVIVRPVFKPEDSARGYVLVIFEEKRTQSAEAPVSPQVATVSAPETIAQQLEEEISHLRMQLRNTIEQYELQQEEQKASNEELQAMNEELRSAAEELETSKEELQSINEELTTVNQELKIKIEELSQTNNDFRNFIASTEIATIFLDRSLRVKLFTPRAREIFNLIPADINRPLLDITHKLAYDDIPADVERVLDSLQSIRREVRTRSGNWYDMRILPYRTTEDRIDGVVVTFIDINSRKKAEEEREQLLAREQTALAASKQAHRVKDEFLAVLSHELKNPLNVILVNAELLLRLPETSSKAREAAQKIRQTALAQARMIDDLLDLSRMQTGKYTINFQPVELTPLIADAVESVRNEAAAKGIRLDVDLGREPLVVKGDSVRIQQVAWNLLNNAIKYTPNNGTIRLTIEKEGGAAVLSVEDSGQGIEPEFLPHIFEMFRQADSSTTRRKGGMGIGLALTKQLVELHGGSIEATSHGSNQGTRFTVRLPLSDAQMPQTGSARTSSQPEHRTNLAGLNILVVDDMPETVETLHDLLETEGATVQMAISAAEALRLIKKTNFDLVITDIAMPDMDGYEMLARLRKQLQTYSLPVIALTGYGREDDIRQALSSGFVAHLKKPVTLDELIRAVGEAIGSRAESEPETGDD